MPSFVRSNGRTLTNDPDSVYTSLKVRQTDNPSSPRKTMRSTKHTAQTTRLARAEKAWSRDSYALAFVATGMGKGVCSKPSHILPTQDRVENPGRRAPFP